MAARQNSLLWEVNKGESIPFIHVGEDQITLVTSVRNLGVIFDSNLKIDMQITKACQNAYYHLHNMMRIRKFLLQEATCTIIHACITSQITYCNSLINGLPQNLKKTPACAKHSCQTSFQSEEICSHNSCTRYVSLASSQIPDLIQNTGDRLQRTSWQSTHPHSRNDHPIKKQKIFPRDPMKGCAPKVPKFKHDTFSKPAFAMNKPLAWNCLPKEIRLCDALSAFKRNLKTHLFLKIVNESTLAIWFWWIIIKRPRLLFAQIVVFYQPCKLKLKPSWLDKQSIMFKKSTIK